MSQLLIRPSVNDHVVIGDLLAPSPVPTIRRLRPPISQLVVDAHVAVQRPAFARSASEAGIPLLIDPLTPLLQCEVDPAERWVSLPFASASAVSPSALEVNRLAEEAVQHQLEMGATRIIAPYLYAAEPDDPAFAVSLRLLEATSRYVQRERLNLPLVAIFCAQSQSFSRQPALAGGIGRFTRVAAEAGFSTIGLCLSPLGAHSDSYAKLSGMIRISTAAMRSGLDIIAWRQGVYGPALAALGLDGYETGVGLSEHTNIVRLQSARRPREKRKGGPAIGLFLEPLGRSVHPRVGNCLLGSIEMRARIVCDDEGCCSDVNAMIDGRRQHAIRSRARVLAELNQQPHRRWRLHHVAQHADTAITIAKQANRVLEANGLKDRIGVKNLEALSRITRELGQAAVDDQSA